jgi:hypothetical protein
MMTLICAWCSKIMKHENPGIPSHGICLECKRVYFVKRLGNVHVG